MHCYFHSSGILFENTMGFYGYHLHSKFTIDQNLMQKLYVSCVFEFLLMQSYARVMVYIEIIISQKDDPVDFIN